MAFVIHHENLKAIWCEYCKNKGREMLCEWCEVEEGCVPMEYIPVDPEGDKYAK